MPLSILTLGTVLIASAAGYAAARWLSTPRAAATTGLEPPTRVASSLAEQAPLRTAPPAEDPGPAREGGHPGHEPMEIRASDRPRG